VIVAYRNVTSEMLAGADTVVAIDGSAPLAEKVIYRRMRVSPSEALTRTARIVVVLLEGVEVKDQLDSLRRMVIEAKSAPALAGSACVRQFADSLEWIEGPAGTSAE
jgi:hypothetical protein